MYAPKWLSEIVMLSGVSDSAAHKSRKYHHFAPIKDDKGPVVVDNAFVQAPRIAPDDGCEWPLLDRVGSASSSRLSKRTNRGKSKQLITIIGEQAASREKRERLRAHMSCHMTALCTARFVSASSP